MIESSLPTFEALCQHHDATPLFADQGYLDQYESIVRAYAALASTTNTPAPTQGALSRPMQARWRMAGLHAIKSVATSENLASVTDRQIDVIVPLILENLWNPDEEALEMLVSRVEVEDKVDSEKLLRRRASVGTAGTADTAELNPVAFSGTANDADMMVEEEIGVLATQCLKSIFVVPNRTKITAATLAILKFIFEKVAAGESVIRLSEKGKHDRGWAISLYKLICRWAPVQDRYVILVVAMDTLINSPIKEDKMEQHMALISIVGSLLRSDVNLIGLSVMDVLLGLVNKIRQLFSSTGGLSRSGSTVEEKLDLGEGSSRKLLVGRLERCIGDVATHVYYADQISDMIVAIFARLRSVRSPSAVSIPQGERADVNEGAPDTSVQDLAESQSSIDNYFSYSKGRVSALRVIKNILLVANPKLKMSGHMNLSRNRVPVQVWEGTYWLLRDPDGEVRKAYVDALTTWLDRETTPADLMAKDDTQPRSSLKQTRDASSPVSTRRAVSVASNRDALSRKRRSQFLAHLHLAIYDNAIQFVDFESDLVVLHVLLTKLVFHLGVNVVRFGIPMIYRLQEDILEMENPIHKMRIASLCHGYFWALTEKFDFETSSVGRTIHSEIIRRRDQKFWVEGINVPLPLLNSVGMPGQTGSQPTLDTVSLETGELIPFDDRSSMVECIATCYEQSARSPPASPAASPSRILGNSLMGSALTSSPSVSQDPEFPGAFREQMHAEWSRETAVAALAAEGKAESLNGSKTGTSTTRNRLTINTLGVNGNGQVASPYGSPRNLRPQSARYPGDQERHRSASKLRKTSVRSGVTPSTNESSRGRIASVDQLKMVLSGDLSAKSIGPLSPDDDDDSDESVLSFEYSPSEASFNPPNSQADQPKAGSTVGRSGSLSRRGPLSLNPTYRRSMNLDGDGEDKDVPPVPPLPNAASVTTAVGHGEENVGQDQASKGVIRKPSSSKGGSVRSKRNHVTIAAHPPQSHQETSGSSMNLQELLLGIDSRSVEGSLGNVTKPPY